MINGDQIVSPLLIKACISLCNRELDLVAVARDCARGEQGCNRQMRKSRLFEGVFDVVGFESLSIPAQDAIHNALQEMTRLEV